MKFEKTACRVGKEDLLQSREKNGLFGIYHYGGICSIIVTENTTAMKVNVSLYGSLARFGGGRHVAQFDIDLADGSGKADLVKQLGIPEKERGYLFINALLCEVPGLSTDANELLKDGDHVGIFSVDRLYPYQYRDGLPMSDGLKAKLSIHGAMHHSYK
jgi:hypothetical protein